MVYRTHKKASLSGLFLSCAVGAATMFLIAAARAEPLLLEIVKAEAAFDERTKEPIVKIKFTESSRDALAKLTTEKVGRPMEMRLDGQVLVKSVVREPILGGSLQISGNFSIEKTQDLAGRLSPGSKVEVEAVSD